ncbi:MAG: PhnD/SsuA/transferrin family substrate-binding protein [Eubacteriales bacterium]|nr:PhnD/SsuA/transferrin family substrate-binding protein [Eubacteriales bacterium]
MKKTLAILLSALLVCSFAVALAEAVVIDELSVVFVPSASVEEMLNASEPLKAMLQDELAKSGYDVKSVKVDVGTDYAVVGEGMISGTIDVGFLPAATYTLYSQDGVDVILCSTRAGHNVVSDDFRDWNIVVENDPSIIASGYRSLIYVNSLTEKGADLLAKAESDTLTWEDVNSAKWALGNVGSGASYVYPSIWLNNSFGEGIGESKKTVENLANATFGGGYPDNLETVVLGQADIYCGFADTRTNDYAQPAFAAAYPELAAEGKTVFDCLKVIGVSDMIMNDTISVGNADFMTDEFKAALQQAFINIIQTDEGKATVAPYSHTGYVPVQDSDFDGTRAALTIFD